MDVEKFRNTLTKFVKALPKTLPTAIPWAGPVIASHFSRLSSEEQRDILEGLEQINVENFQLLRTELEAVRVINLENARQLREWLEREATRKKLPQLIAVVPTGGRAGSMYPYSLAMPKSLFIVNTKPMLCHIIDSLDKEMFPQVLIQTSEFSAAIEACLRVYEPRLRCIRIDQDVPAMLLELKNELRTTFLVHYCDILTVDLNWSSIYARYSELRQKYNIIGAFVGSAYYPLGVGLITENPTRPGLLEKIDEKPEDLIGVFANTAISLFEPSFLDYVKKSDSSIYRESVARAIKKGKERFGVIKIGKWWHIHDVRALFDKQKEYYPKEIAEQ